MEQGFKWSSVEKKSIFLMIVGPRLGLTWYLPGPQWKEKARAAAGPHLCFFTLRAAKCSISLRQVRHRFQFRPLYLFVVCHQKVLLRVISRFDLVGNAIAHNVGSVFVFSNARELGGMLTFDTIQEATLGTRIMDSHTSIPSMSPPPVPCSSANDPGSVPSIPPEIPARTT